jgi:thioester reductase-like protein
LYGSQVYCIIRENNIENCIIKLKNSLAFYFGETKADTYLRNVRVVYGDIARPNLGMTADVLEQAKNEVKTVIHCAAFTNHYGMQELFEKSNILGTRNITEFCLKTKKPLLYISTMSVSGVCVENDSGKKYVFDETCYYIGQEYEGNEYRKSKFLAEGIVLRAREQGLDIRIFRVGNLTARASDGRFQMVKENNAFANRLKSVFEIGMVPDHLAGLPLEFTPVDLSAKAILLLARKGGEHPLIYHLYNHNKITVKDFIKGSRGVYPPPAIVPSSVFEDTIRDILRREDSVKLAGIINDISQQSTVQNITTASEKTAKILHQEGFEWPRIHQEYIIKFVKTSCGN